MKVETDTEFLRFLPHFNLLHSLIQQILNASNVQDIEVSIVNKEAIIPVHIKLIKIDMYGYSWMNGVL